MLVQDAPGVVEISTHVPRMGDDGQRGGDLPGAQAISTHVPRMGDDRRMNISCSGTISFLPTSPVWGTTGARWAVIPAAGGISTHVPRMGDDLGKAQRTGTRTEFLPTSPVWGTTANMTKKVLELRQHLQQKDMVYKMISAFLYNLHLLARHFGTVLPLVSVRTGLWFAVCLVVALKLRKAIYRKCGDYTKWWLQ